MVRGDVHAVTLPRRRGHAQHGRRYAVIVQADDLLELSTIVVVCPTSQSTAPASFHPQVTVDGDSTRVMCEMVGVVDARALGDHVGHLTYDEMLSIDESLALVLDLR